jgi:uncharacterized protein (TIRG00374 family)
MAGPVATEAVVPVRPRSVAVKRIIGLVAYALIVVVTLRTLDTRQFWATLMQLRLGHVLGVLGFVFVHLGARIARYYLLVLPSKPVGFGLRDAVRIYLAGVGAAAVTPARSGDLLKAELMRAYGVRRAAGLGVVLIERYLDLASCAATVFAVGLLLPRSTEVWRITAAAAVLLLALAVAGCLLSLKRARERGLAILSRGSSRISKRFAADKIEHVSACVFETWDGVFHAPGKLVGYSVMSVLLWLADFSKLAFLFHCLGANVPLLAVWFVYPTSLIAAILSFLPFGEGVVGVTAVVLFGSIAGVELHLATAAIVLDRGISLVTPLLGYAVVALISQPSPVRSSR